MLLLLLLGVLEGVTADDVVRLSKSGVGEEVIVSHLRAQKAVFHLSTDEIVRLKENGVSDRVLQYMINPSGGAAPAAGDKAALTLSHQDDRPCSVMVDENAKRIFYYFGNMQDRVVLSKNDSRDLTVAPGTYTVRWVGEPQSFAATLLPERPVKLITSPVHLTGVSALALSVMEGEREASGGTLKTYEDRRAAVEHTRQNPTPAAQTVPTVIYRQVTEPVIVHHAYPYGNGWPGYRHSPPLFTPNTIFWSGVGAAAYRHRRWKGAGIGFAFGHLLDWGDWSCR